MLEKRTSHGSCQPLKIERLHCRTYLAGLNSRQDLCTALALPRSENAGDGREAPDPRPRFTVPSCGDPDVVCVLRLE